MDINEAMEHSREILKALFIENISTLCTLNNNEKNIKYKISAKNSNYVETPYYYKEKKLLHFTSVQNLCEIINSNSIRMFSLDNCNDTLELDYWKNMFNKPDFDFYKNHHILSASFTKPDKYDDLLMWRLYGDKGNGVCLEFTIENEQENWHKFLLAPIQYQKDDTVVKSYFEAIKKFKADYGYEINLDLSPIIPFFKSADWDMEHEIRMIYYNDDLVDDFSIKRLEVVKQQGLIYYTSFPLNHISKQEEFKIIDEEKTPKIRISKIYTGFGTEDAKFDNLRKMINSPSFLMQDYSNSIELIPLEIKSKIR